MIKDMRFFPLSSDIETRYIFLPYTFILLKRAYLWNIHENNIVTHTHTHTHNRRLFVDKNKIIGHMMICAYVRKVVDTKITWLCEGYDGFSCLFIHIYLICLFNYLFLCLFMRFMRSPFIICAHPLLIFPFAL